MSTMTNGMRSHAIAISSLLLCVTAVSAQNRSPEMSFRHATAFAISPPLRELADLPAHPHYGLPQREPFDSPSFRTGLSDHSVDPVEQRAPGTTSSISPSLSIPGLMRDSGQTRPDTNAAVGDAQLVEWENVQYAVYNKTTGALEVGPVDGNMLWQSLGGPCYENNDG